MTDFDTKLAETRRFLAFQKAKIQKILSPLDGRATVSRTRLIVVEESTGYMVADSVEGGLVWIQWDGSRFTYTDGISIVREGSLEEMIDHAVFLLQEYLP